jgi:hypothetical protein
MPLIGDGIAGDQTGACSGGLLLLDDLEKHEPSAMRERLADQWMGFVKTRTGSVAKCQVLPDVMCGRVTSTNAQEKYDGARRL